jgi:spore cortex formation protein SpoVR/YcgB (stage V sporulation)
MSLSNASIRSIIKASCNDDPPLRLGPNDKPSEILKTIRDDLIDAGFDEENVSLEKRDEKPILSIEVVSTVSTTDDEDDDEASDSCTLELEFLEEELHVSIKWDSDAFAITNVEHLLSIVNALEKRMVEDVNRQKKQARVKELKIRAIDTQVHAIAQRLGFKYSLEEKHTKVVLEVELDKHNSLLVDIPIKQLQETIDCLEDLVKQVRDHYGRGVRFKIARR